MQELLIHLFVVIPVVGHIFKLPHWSRMHKIVAAIGFLSALAGASLVHEYWGSTPNLYQVVGVRSDISATDLKRHCRNVSAKLHPDKNPSPTAEQEFVVFREACDFLSVPGYRSNYDRFGASAIRASEKPGDGGNQLILGAAVSALMFYSIWAFMTFLMMSGKDCERGRRWALTCLVGLFLLEIQMTLNPEFDVFSSLLPAWTPHEKMALFHKLFGSVFTAVRILSQVTYVDVELMEQQRLALIHENTKAAVSLLLALHNQVAALKLSKSAAAAHARAVDGPAIVEDGGEEEPVLSSSATSPLPAAPEVMERLQRAQELLGLQGGLREGAPVRQNGPARPKPKEEPKSMLWSIVSYAAVPLVLNFLLNR
jgi:hypothetical protein